MDLTDWLPSSRLQVMVDQGWGLSQSASPAADKSTEACEARRISRILAALERRGGGLAISSEKGQGRVRVGFHMGSVGCPRGRRDEWAGSWRRIGGNAEGKKRARAVQECLACIATCSKQQHRMLISRADWPDQTMLDGLWRATWTVQNLKTAVSRKRPLTQQHRVEDSIRARMLCLRRLRPGGRTTGQNEIMNHERKGR